MWDGNFCTGRRSARTYCDLICFRSCISSEAGTVILHAITSSSVSELLDFSYKTCVAYVLSKPLCACKKEICINFSADMTIVPRKFRARLLCPECTAIKTNYHLTRFENFFKKSVYPLDALQLPTKKTALFWKAWKGEHICIFSNFPVTVTYSIFDSVSRGISPISIVQYECSVRTLPCPS